LQSDISAILFFLLSLLMAILIYFYINIIFGSLAFWSRDVWAPRFLLMVIMEFATGAMFPLDMLPDIGRKLALLTPFPYLLYVPMKIYLGQDSHIALSLGLAFGWLILLWYLTRRIWQKGLKLYEAEGR